MTPKFEKNEVVHIVNVTDMEVCENQSFRRATILEKYAVVFTDGVVMSIVVNNGEARYGVSVHDGMADVRIWEFGLVPVGGPITKNEKE